MELNASMVEQIVRQIVAQDGGVVATTVADGYGVMVSTAVGDATEAGRVTEQATVQSEEQTPLDVYKRQQLLGEELMRGKVGAAVAIEPSTGEILMIVSSPTYDPDELVAAPVSVKMVMIFCSRISAVLTSFFTVK